MERISNSQLEILINFGIKKLDISRTMSALRELKERREVEQSGFPGELPAGTISLLKQVKIFLEKPPFPQKDHADAVGTAIKTLESMSWDTGEEKPGELPADLQEVYNLLHLSEEQFEVLDNFLEKSLTAIKVASKHEKIIADMADWIQGTAEVGEYCDECQYFDAENESCTTAVPVECRANIIEYYKKRAGLKCTKTLQTE